MKLFTKEPVAWQTLHRYFFWSFMLIGVLLISLSAAPVMAGRTDKHKPTGYQEETQGPLQFQKATVTIQSKTRKRISTSAFTSYAVTAGVLIYGPDGKTVSLKNLMVPCDAEVIYINENGVRSAVRINVKRIAADATSHMLLEKDEKE
jgi:hypothetical protein